MSTKELMVLEKTLASILKEILKEISPEYSLEGLLLKLQYFGHLMRRTDSSEKTLMLGKTRQAEKGATEDEMVAWHH